MSKVINRAYENYADAVSVIHQLEAAGISHNDISIVANNVNDDNDPTHKDAVAKGAGAATTVLPCAGLHGAPQAVVSSMSRARRGGLIAASGVG